MIEVARYQVCRAVSRNRRKALRTLEYAIANPKKQIQVTGISVGTHDVLFPVSVEITRGDEIEGTRRPVVDTREESSVRLAQKHSDSGARRPARPKYDVWSAISIEVGRGDSQAETVRCPRRL